MNQNVTEAAAVRLLTPKASADRVGCSLRNLQRMVREGRAPIPVKISQGRIGFYEHEVNAWLAALPRTREAA